jgi:sugar lactone lactonase YvrE
VKNGKAAGMDVVVEGFIVANGMVWKGDTLFVTDTILRHSPQTEQGQPKPPLLSGVYGIVWREKDGRIHVADMLLNAVHAIDGTGGVSTVHQNGDTDGSNGLLDQPRCRIVLLLTDFGDA